MEKAEWQYINFSNTKGEAETFFFLGIFFWDADFENVPVNGILDISTKVGKLLAPRTLRLRFI